MHWCDRGLCEADVVLCDVVGRLVLGDLHTRAHVALPVEEEGEGARQALAGGRKTEHKQKTLEGHRAAWSFGA